MSNQEEPEEDTTHDEDLIDYLNEEELIKSARKVNMRKPKLEIPSMSINSRISSGANESDPSPPTVTPTFNSIKLESKPHTEYSRDPSGKKPYTSAEQRADLKRAIQEEIKQKMEAAGEANTNPRIPRLIALRNTKKITITTDKGTYSTPDVNVIVGIHGRNRFDVQIQNKKHVYKH